MFKKSSIILKTDVSSTLNDDSNANLNVSNKIDSKKVLFNTNVSKNIAFKSVASKKVDSNKKSTPKTIAFNTIVSNTDVSKNIAFKRVGSKKVASNKKSTPKTIAFNTIVSNTDVSKTITSNTISYNKKELLKKSFKSKPISSTVSNEKFHTQKSISPYSNLNHPLRDQHFFKTSMMSKANPTTSVCENEVQKKNVTHNEV